MRSPAVEAAVVKVLERERIERLSRGFAWGTATTSALLANHWWLFVIPTALATALWAHDRWRVRQLEAKASQVIVDEWLALHRPDLSSNHKEQHP